MARACVLARFQVAVPVREVAMSDRDRLVFDMEVWAEVEGVCAV